MTTWNPDDDYVPTTVVGRVKRCSPVIREGKELVVYLHIEEQLPGLRGWQEAPLIHRVSKNLSLNALMVQAGDRVHVQWIPIDCKRIRDAETIAYAIKFHLSREVAPAYGKGYRDPL